MDASAITIWHKIILTLYEVSDKPRELQVSIRDSERDSAARRSARSPTIEDDRVARSGSNSLNDAVIGRVQSLSLVGASLSLCGDLTSMLGFIAFTPTDPCCSSPNATFRGESIIAMLRLTASPDLKLYKGVFYSLKVPVSLAGHRASTLMPDRPHVASIDLAATRSLPTLSNRGNDFVATQFELDPFHRKRRLGFQDRLNSEHTTVTARDTNGTFLLSVFEDGGKVLSRFREGINFHRLNIHDFDSEGSRRKLQ